MDGSFWIKGVGGCDDPLGPLAKGRIFTSLATEVKFSVALVCMQKKKKKNCEGVLGVKRKN